MGNNLHVEEKSIDMEDVNDDGQCAMANSTNGNGCNRKGKSSYLDPSLLRPDQREALRLIAAGVSYDEISQRTGLSRKVIVKLQRSPAGREVLEKLNDKRDEIVINTIKELASLAPLAVEHYKRCLSDLKNKKYTRAQQLKIASEVLDRIGVAAAPSVQHHHLHAHLSAVDLEELKQRAKNVLAAGR